MRDLSFHLLLFTIAGFVIVAMSSMFTERDDARALRTIPRRMLYFFVGCGIVAGVMLLIEHTVASVS